MAGVRKGAREACFHVGGQGFRSRKHTLADALLPEVTVSALPNPNKPQTPTV